MGFGMAVASAGLYANNRPLLQADSHISTSSVSFLQAGCSSWCPTNSVKALKAKYTTSIPTDIVWPPQHAVVDAFTHNRQF